MIIKKALKRFNTPDNKNNDSVTQIVTPATSMPSTAKKQRISEYPDNFWKSFGRPAYGESFTVKKSPVKSKGSSSSGSDDNCVLIDDPVEIASLKLVAMSSNICTGCGNKSTFCHKRLYCHYCLRVVYGYFHNDMTNCH